jgi:hypothetical protein
MKAPQQRPWREIATQIASETDPGKILELSQELTRAIDKQIPSLSKIAPGQRELLPEPET